MDFFQSVQWQLVHHACFFRAEGMKKATMVIGRIMISRGNVMRSIPESAAAMTSKVRKLRCCTLYCPQFGHFLDSSIGEIVMRGLL